ncbi:hypothetical protein HYS99_00825 [Candidatus Giovannonibacteria bacterium]|nr:hypothetical protein [Candidatus Giovannonibacteria bacterium]
MDDDLILGEEFLSETVDQIFLDDAPQGETLLSEKLLSQNLEEELSLDDLPL